MRSLGSGGSLTVTAIIPCYNAALYIADAIQSVMGQTRAADEIVVVDDCSTDDSGEIAKRMGARVLRTAANSGAGAARNLGIRSARGDVIAWLDADDVWEPHHLATVVPLLEANPEAAVAFGLVREFGDRMGAWPAILPAGAACDALEACLHRCVVPHIAVVVRAEALRAIDGYDETMRLAEDYDVWLRLSARHQFVCTHDVTANWRQHGAQISGGSSGGASRLTAYWEMEYASRGRFRRWTRGAWEASRHAAVEAAVLRVSEGHLMSAWWGRDAEQLRFHLERVPDVPGAPALRRRWAWRARAIPVARAWDVVRTPARAVARAFGHRRHPPRTSDA